MGFTHSLASYRDVHTTNSLALLLNSHVAQLHPRGTATPTRYGNTQEVHLHLQGTATPAGTARPTRYSYIYEIQLHTRDTDRPTMYTYSVLELLNKYNIRRNENIMPTSIPLMSRYKRSELLE